MPPDPRSPEVQRTIALHEAGHAVVAAALGAPLQSVTIVPRGTSGGSARLQLEDVVSRATIERRVVMLLAGRAADIAFSGEAFGNAGADLVLATRFLSEAHARMGLGATLFALDDPHPAMHYSDALRRSVEADLERLWSLATALVEQERSAIMAVAEALLLRRILSADDVHRLRTAAHRGAAARPPQPAAVRRRFRRARRARPCVIGAAKAAGEVPSARPAASVGAGADPGVTAALQMRARHGRTETSRRA